MQCPAQPHTLLLKMTTQLIQWILLMINNNHFNTLRVKGETKSIDFQKVKKKDYRKLESKVEKSEMIIALWVSFHLYIHKMH